jgi:hypothetical protein
MIDNNFPTGSDVQGDDRIHALPTEAFANDAVTLSGDNVTQLQCTLKVMSVMSLLSRERLGRQRLHPPAAHSINHTQVGAA